MTSVPAQTAIISAAKPNPESVLIASSIDQSSCSDDDKRSDISTDQASNNVRTVKFSDLDTVHEDDSC